MTQPIGREDRSSAFYNEQCVGRCCERPCLLSRLRPHAQPTGCVWTAHLWPELLCPAWHLIYLKPITRLLPRSPPWKWQCHMWWREPESRAGPQPWFSVCLSVCGSAVLHSFSPTSLLSQLVPAEAIDIITVLATEERKGVDRWVPTLAKWDLENILWGCFKVKVQMARHINSCLTLTFYFIIIHISESVCVRVEPLSQDEPVVFRGLRCRHVVFCRSHMVSTHTRALSSFTYITTHWFNYTGSWPCDILLLIYDVTRPFTSQPSKTGKPRAAVSQEFKPLELGKHSVTMKANYQNKNTKNPLCHGFS